MDFAAVLLRVEAVYDWFDLSPDCGQRLEALRVPAEVAAGLTRELRLQTFLADIPGEVLADLVPAADDAIAGRDDSHEFYPVLTAATLCVYELLYQRPSEAWVHDIVDGSAAELFTALEMGERRFAALLLLEALRRLGAYGKLTLPTDPWDDSELVEIDEPNEAVIAAFKQQLGYLGR